MKTENVVYNSGENSFEGYLAQPEGESHPCILIAHTWSGRDAFVEEKAKLSKTCNFCPRQAVT